MRCGGLAALRFLPSAFPPFPRPGPPVPSRNRTSHPAVRFGGRRRNLRGSVRQAQVLDTLEFPFKVLDALKIIATHDLHRAKSAYRVSCEPYFAIAAEAIG